MSAARQERLSLVGSALLELPLLSPIPWHSRLIFKSTPERKHALVSAFSLVDDDDVEPGQAEGGVGGRRAVVVVNVHLDAMGDNSHRTRQLQALRAQHSHAHCLAAVRAGRDGLVDRVWCAGR